MDRHVQGVVPLSPIGSSSEDGEAGQLVHPNREAGDQEDLKLTRKARRKEQCRVNQANYRKRKRAYEQQLAGYIKNLEDEINDLTARRETLSQLPLSEQSNQDEKSSPEEGIASFYQYLQDHRPTKAFSNGARIELSSALDLQWEEFASIEQLRHQWSLYVHQFDTFQVEMTSSDHFQAGDHVIVRITGSLFIRIANQESLNPADSEKWFYSVIRCPVQHRFEFDVYENKFTRITSEVDWVSGIATSTNTRPETVLEMLHELLQTSC
ncbi:hypothetical protein Poli38472_009457 [Pythium oligandrum]|uniref:BZIP domain-containing protein n=1 Tax=Pythium oligandrum TaxID=41045 RepID=A0A8K1FID5_PYTOL|nr:hypothetical protein Poli38472_009457 [Pythium oligandrum]|eukprot:TMW61964.1 hypothetical protein Poli38472_009457 [Pythium oligandrum]